MSSVGVNVEIGNVRQDVGSLRQEVDGIHHDMAPMHGNIGGLQQDIGTIRTSIREEMERERRDASLHAGAARRLVARMTLIGEGRQRAPKKGPREH